MMTATEIKAMSAAGNSDWEVLAAVIADGREFPDAEFAVKQALRMDEEQRAEMVEKYDSVC